MDKIIYIHKGLFVRTSAWTSAIFALSLLVMSGCVRDRVAIFTPQEDKTQLQLKVIEGDFGFSTEGPRLEKEIGAALNLNGNKQEFSLTDLDNGILFCSRGAYKGTYSLSALSITINEGKIKVNMTPTEKKDSHVVNFFNGEYRTINSIEEARQRSVDKP